jgi:hypothetical protein
MRKKYLPKPAEASGPNTARRLLSSPPLEIHLSRSADRFEGMQLKEPELIFGENQRCVDPRTGLAAWGPYSNGGGTSGSQLRVGIVGTGEAIERALSLLQEISAPVEPDPNLDCILHPSFPGLNSGKPFSVDVVTQTSWHRSINPQMVRLAADCDHSIAKYGMLRELYGAQVRAMSRLEFPPNVVICAVPARLERSLLYAACSQSLPIEIVCEGKSTEAQGAELNKATNAWDLSVRLLYKAGLIPWRLADAAGDTCFVGVSFYRDVENAPSHAWTGFAHMITDLGQGFVLKGDTIVCNPAKEAMVTPHLDEDQAAKLMWRTLEVFRKNAGRMPRKVVVHKISPYSEAERLGFGDSLRGVEQHALVSVSRSKTFILRAGRKPISRGMAIPFGEKLGLIYVTGYIPFLRCYPGNRRPQPLEITENWGSLKFQEVARDLFRLTKLNWSTSAFCTDVPATLAPAGQTHEIMKILGQQGLVLDDRSYL